MDIQLLLSEVAKETGIKLSEDDPLLAAVYINKILFATYTSKVQEELESSLLKISAKEKETFDKISNLLNQRDKNVSNRIDATIKHFSSVIDKQITTISPSTQTKAKKNLFGIIIALLVGILIGSGLAIYLM